MWVQQSRYLKIPLSSFQTPSCMPLDHLNELTKDLMPKLIELTMDTGNPRYTHTSSPADSSSPIQPGFLSRSTNNGHRGSTGRCNGTGSQSQYETLKCTHYSI